MAYTLACRDSGVDCPYVARGETFEEMWEDASTHVKEVHGYTDEQLNDPKLKEEMKSLIKKT
jgi:predicted small metal-binding protein